MKSLTQTFICTSKTIKSFYRGITILLLLLVFGFTGRSQIIINELGIAPTTGDAAGGGEFIELFNQGPLPVDIGCYVIFFSSTSGSNNPTGFSITIPPGTMLNPCAHYLIGGSGLSPATTAWTNTGTGGNTWINNYGANGLGSPHLNANTAGNTSLQSLVAGNLVNTRGQVTIFNPAGTAVTSVSYNSGNNPASYPGSFTNPPPGCNIINPINPGPATQNVNAVFSGAGTQGIYLNSSGTYSAETSLLPDFQIH